MSDIQVVKKLKTKLVSLRVEEDRHQRLRQVKDTSSIDIGETLRLWFDDCLAHMEREAHKFPKKTG